jgi:hypothetical protein
MQTFVADAKQVSGAAGELLRVAAGRLAGP